MIVVEARRHGKFPGSSAFSSAREKLLVEFDADCSTHVRIRGYMLYTHHIKRGKGKFAFSMSGTSGVVPRTRAGHNSLSRSIGPLGIAHQVGLYCHFFITPNGLPRETIASCVITVVSKFIDFRCHFLSRLVTQCVACETRWISYTNYFLASYL